MDIYKLKKILSRYLKGQSNETESALVEAWYRSYDAEEKSLDNNEAIALRNSIKSRIDADTVKPRIILMRAFRIAATLAIFSVVGLSTWKFSRREANNEAYTIVITGTKGLKELKLPDGSTVWLNAASRIKVPNAFTGPRREVVLEEGEAFFDIKHDAEHPFIVHSAPINVQVLGTSFNVRAYKALQTISVAVATGKVGITGKSKTLAMLLLGQQLSFNTLTGETAQSNVNADFSQSWKKGYTYLNQASFNELALVVKNIYGLSLKPANKKISNYRFSMRLVHNMQSKQILELISQLHHTHYRKEGTDIILY
jgi:transmembrane sensor